MTTVVNSSGLKTYFTFIKSVVYTFCFLKCLMSLFHAELLQFCTVHSIDRAQSLIQLSKYKGAIDNLTSNFLYIQFLSNHIFLPQNALILAALAAVTTAMPSYIAVPADQIAFVDLSELHLHRVPRQTLSPPPPQLPHALYQQEYHPITLQQFQQQRQQQRKWISYIVPYHNGEMGYI